MKIKIIILFFSFLLCSCKADKNSKSISPRIKSLSKVLSPSNNEIIKKGDSILIEVKSINENNYIINSKVIIKDDTINFDKKLRFSSKRFNKYGKKQIKIIRQLSNNKIETDIKSIYIYPIDKPKSYNYEILKILPHDINTYTQGLILYNNMFFESSGQYGKSFLRKINSINGNIIKEIKIDDNYFAEGITIHDKTIYMLTWKSKKGFKYDLDSFEKKGEFNYQSEGWGLTTLNNQILMSDGTEKIYFRDPQTFNLEKTIEVYNNNGKVENINELEIINGKLYCNIYGKDIILIIDPYTGLVIGEINLENIFNRKNYNNTIDVMNGIAYNKENNSIIITGKWWPSMYEIKILN